MQVMDRGRLTMELLFLTMNTRLELHHSQQKHHWILAENDFYNHQ